jgi:hypothetical protein
VGSQVLGVYVYGFFFQYTALSALNYLSVYLGAIMYGLVMRKFLIANRPVKAVAVA